LQFNNLKFGSNANDSGSNAKGLGRTANGMGRTARDMGMTADDLGTIANEMGTIAKTTGTIAEAMGTTADDLGTAAIMRFLVFIGNEIFPKTLPAQAKTELIQELICRKEKNFSPNISGSLPHITMGEALMT
jgi:hypothetical protein